MTLKDIRRIHGEPTEEQKKEVSKTLGDDNE